MRKVSGMKTKIIYIACPYAHRNVAIRERRYKLVTLAAANLAKAGYIVFSPITHAHPMQIAVNHSIKGNWDFWQQLDLPILEICGLLIVLTLTGWAISEGVNGELAAADRMHIPIIYIDVDEIKDLARIINV